MLYIKKRVECVKKYMNKTTSQAVISFPAIHVFVHVTNIKDRI